MILKGKKVTLRPMNIGDAKLTAKWGSDPDVNKFSARNKCTVKEMEKWITKDLPKDKDFKKFAVTKKDGALLGNIGIAIVKKDNYAEYDIILGNKSEWNKGYGYEASKILLDYGFKKLKLHYVYLHVFDYNKAAIRLYNKLGFKKEGVMRESVLYKGKYHDKIIMGLLAEEWGKKKVL